jgi:hypothetical protein
MGFGGDHGFPSWCLPGSPVTAQDWKRHLTAGSNICEKKRKRVDEIRIAVFNGFVSRARLNNWGTAIKTLGA